MNIRFTLRDYSFFTGVLLSASDFSNAQIIYTDLEPDAVVGADNQFIDLNNDGFDDFQILRSFDFTSNTELVKCYSSIRFTVGCMNPENSLVGNQRDDVNDIVYALPFDTLVNESVELTPDGWQYATFKQREVSCVYGSPIGSWIYPNIGNWASQTEEDVYIGVKFKDDIESCFHFGWIRCVISDTLQQITIKDYAYNEDCNKGIYTGKLISGINNFDTESDFGIYYSDGAFYLSSNNNIKNSICRVFNTSGQEIFKQCIINEKTIITTGKLISGIYFIQVVTPKGDKIIKSIQVF